MREIKFRAWDKTMEKYIDWGSLLSSFNVKNVFYGICNLDLEQFTGLKDMDQKDIYEGDIIHHKWANPSDWIVIFENGSFGFRHTDADSFDTLIGWEDAVKVVGNIHEVTP